jgi:hypothetical protein
MAAQPAPHAAVQLAARDAAGYRADEQAAGSGPGGSASGAQAAANAAAANTSLRLRLPGCIRWLCYSAWPRFQRARSGQPVMNNGGWGRKRAHARQRRAHTVLAGHLSTLHCANVVLAALHSLGASRSTASPAAGLPLVVRTPAGRAPTGSSQGLLHPSSRGPGQLPTLGGRSRQSGLEFACARPGSW